MLHYVLSEVLCQVLSSAATHEPVVHTEWRVTWRAICGTAQPHDALPLDRCPSCVVSLPHLTTPPLPPSLSLSLSGGRARDRVLGLLITTLRRGPQTFGFGSAVVIYKTRILDRVTTWGGCECTVGLVLYC